MARKQRLDLELVARGLAASRQQAQQLIRAGRVRLGDRVLDKPGTEVLPEAELASLTEAAGMGLQQRPQDIAPKSWVALAKGLNQAMRATDPLPTPAHG